MDRDEPSRSGLHEVAEDLHVADDTVRFYGVRIPTRMALLRLPPDRLLLYSPIFATPALRRAVDALGEVRWIVSPNKIHNQTLAAWRAAYPGARLLAPPGLPERRPGLRFDAVLGAEPEPGWAGELSVALTAGNVFFSEVLILHRRSRTLLVGDLVENLTDATLTPLARALARAFGVPGRPVASPEHRLYTVDARTAGDALAVPRAWDFDRIFLCHGVCIERGASAVFASVCDELLERARRRRAVTRWLARRLAALQ